MNLNEYLEHYNKGLIRLSEWASSIGAKVIQSKPWQKEEIDIFPEMIQPYFGTFNFFIPPGYHAFLQVCSSLKLEVNWGEADDPDWAPFSNLCCIYHPDEIINARGHVLIPEGVSGDNNRYLSTNHLLGFAVANDISDTYWCFITDQPDSNGELPIILHCTDELHSARYLDTNEYVEPEHVKIRYTSFLDWFDDYIKELTDMNLAELESKM